MAPARKEKKTNTLTILGFLALAVTVGSYITFISMQEPLPQRNAETYCLDQIHKINVVLLDVSQELTDNHQQALQQQVNNLWQNIGPEERIDLYITQNTGKTNVLPISSFCNPSKEGSDLTEGQMVREHRHRNMWKKLEQAYLASRQDLGRDESPIIEAMLAIGTTSLAEARQAQIPAKLTIISDMIQNSTTLNQYSEQPKYESFRNRAKYERVKPDLNGAQVTILYLQRPGRESLQGGAHATFWASLINDTGGTFGDPAIEKIRGGAK